MASNFRTGTQYTPHNAPIVTTKKPGNVVELCIHKLGKTLVVENKEMENFKTSHQPGRLTGNKHLVFILTQGQPDENFFKDIYPKYAQFLQWEGFTQTHLIRGCGLMAPEDASSNENLLHQAENLAKEILG
jgi:hypothetical protein